ncbi:hypothetical protein [Streptomyces capitiformicae]|uniref:Uncharacterized protein n=1 Tax=Streptomyces capitiformicae TaxID=2014920 RepID=A0A918ZEV7_9ACTN|nr:hypothetical protein [Streptomyces capitiformicae]GHE47558.1 hypothetical protein GCM10017771_68450 [Streptomyces capitiformicae]
MNQVLGSQYLASLANGVDRVGLPTDVLRGPFGAADLDDPFADASRKVASPARAGGGFGVRERSVGGGHRRGGQSRTSRCTRPQQLS